MLKPSKIEYNKGNRNIVLFKKKIIYKNCYRLYTTTHLFGSSVFATIG